MDENNIQGDIEGVFEESINEEKKYFGVFQKGGSIGQGKDEPLHSFVDKEEAKQKAKRLRQTLTPGEKSYYRMGYIVRPTNVAPESLNEDIYDKFLDDPQSPKGRAKAIISKFIKTIWRRCIWNGCR